MEIPNLHQPPFETTLMGVVKAALDHYGHGVSDANVYGGSGHAFLINVHEKLCPSSPYCWSLAGMAPLLRNLGVEMVDLGFFHAGSPPEARAAVERALREHLDAGRPCSLCNMDNQVVYGYDEHAILTARPWPKNPDYPPGRLTYGTWAELGDEVHVNFHVFERRERAADATIHRDSLAYAVELHRRPEPHAFEHYAVGPGAYDHWAAAAATHGATHGNWWNGTVWAECRRQASAYLAEMGTALDAGPADLARALSSDYAGIAEGLSKLADREMDAGSKTELAQDLKRREAAAIDRVEALLGELTSAS